MSIILELLAGAFEHVRIPHSFYDTNPKSMHVKINDCMLYLCERNVIHLDRSQGSAHQNTT